MNVLKLLLLLAFSAVSCSESVYDNWDKTDNFDIATAQMFYDKHFTTIKVPQILQSNELTKSIDQNFELTVLWDNYSYVEDDYSYNYEFNLSGNHTPIFSLYENINGSIKLIDKGVFIKSSLIIQKSKISNDIRLFVSTMLGYMVNSDKSVGFLKYTDNKEYFYGYQIFTDINGNYLPSTLFYSNGTCKNIHLKKYDDCSQLPSIFFAILNSSNTKAESPGYRVAYCPQCGTKNHIPGPCSSCGYPLYWDMFGDDDSGGLGTPCPTCNMSPCICEPCLRCGNDPCICPGPNDGCQYCYSKDCQGECRN